MRGRALVVIAALVAVGCGGRSRSDGRDGGSGDPCDDPVLGLPQECYEGPEGTLGVGVCVRGVRLCRNGEWGPCEAQVLPQDEVCNELDDDCDGTVDEGVRNECGGCGECGRPCVGRGEGCEPWDVDEEGEGVELGGEEKGCIALDWTFTAQDHAWIPNTSQGTISRIHAIDLVEEGRFLTSAYGLGPAASPSRTAVEPWGTVVVANQAFGGQASVTRIAAGHCPDQDEDGRVVTSTGRDDVLEWGEDECVLWSTDVGCVGDGCGVARAVVVQDRVGLDGIVLERVWVGLEAEQRFVELDRSDGSETGQEVDVSPCAPSDAAIDEDGNVWSACESTTLVRFDTRDPGDLEVLTGPQPSYGVTVNFDGDVWLSGHCQRYDPLDDEFTVVDDCTGTGIATEPEGHVWIGGCEHGGASGTCRIHERTLEVAILEVPSHGVDVDERGMVWGVPRSGWVELIDPFEWEAERLLDDCDGEPCLGEPDAIGELIPHWSPAASGYGTYRHVFVAPCEGAVGWASLTWDAAANDGTIEWLVRAAASRESLEDALWIPAGEVPGTEPPVDLGVVLDDAGLPYVEVEALLRPGGRGGMLPVLCSMGSEYACLP